MDVANHQLVLLGALLCLFAVYAVTSKKRLPRGLRLPPGPQGLPLIGNLADMPSRHQWLTFTRWAQQYGDLVYVKVFGVSMVVVNSLDVANDLLEKKSSIYSDRYEFPMLMLMGFGWNLGLMKYGTKWRSHRKTFLRGFHPAAVKAYFPTQTKWTRDLLRRLQDSPNEFSAHLGYHSGAIIMEIVYGIKVLPKEDPYIHTAEEAMSFGAEAANPGAFLVDILPCLRYIPEWVPGAGFKKKAREWRVPVTETAELPFRVVKEDLDTGNATPSVTKSLLEELYRKEAAPSVDDEEVIRNAAAVAYAAGSDSTSVAMSWFMLAMVLYPDIQQKAQAELDSIIGNRLPTFDDRGQLPYINALCKEIQRWNPVAPLGIAHAVSQDDSYKGLFIPKGSIVIGNTWAMLRDEKVFGPRTEEFSPDRFLKSGTCDPTVAFGFGRRICPGRHMASNTIFIAVASILKVFNISHAIDSKGNKIPVKPLSTPGTITRPEDFQCSILPRSETAMTLLPG